MSTTTSPASQPSTPPRRAPAAIWALNGAIALLATVVTVVLMRGMPAPSAPVRVAFPFLAVAFALGHFGNVRFEQRNTNYSCDLANAVLLPALVLSRPALVVLSMAIGTTAYSLYSRRPPSKAVFNVALHALAASFALFVYHASLAGSSPISLRGTLAAIAAVCAAEFTTHVGVSTAVSIMLSQWTPFRSRQAWLVLLFAVGTNAALGLGAIQAIWASGTIELIFLGLSIVIAVEYVLHGRLRVRHRRLQQLYEFERSLAALVESDQVIAAVLTEALHLMNTEIAQLVLTEHFDVTECVTYSLGAGASMPTSSSGPHPLIALLGGAAELLAPRSTPDPALRRALEACGFRDALVLALEVDDGAAPAFLVIANRLGGQTVTFGPPDIPMAETLTAPAAMALRSSKLLTKLREEIASKEHEATHDPLTGLANRILIYRELEQALVHRSAGALVGVMVVDMDDFKGVNDGFGHEVGDAFLQVVADRLAATVGSRGHVGRLGGDEFAVVVPYARHPAEIATLAADVDIAIRAEAAAGGTTVERRASIGVSLAPQHGNDRATLLRAADLSMYLAKQRGGGVVVYSHSHDGELDRPSLLAALREALASSSLDLAYQPKVALDTGKVVGVEALLRWTHPVLGPISPERFVPEAESSGLIRPLTRWVLATAIAQCSMWHQEGLDLHVAVNLSPTQMDDEEVVTQVRQLLDAHRLPAGSLVLEITESGAIEDFPGDHAHVLRPLADMGVQLSIDDFGVGTSSLSRIKHLPVTEIKIDRSFITDLSPDSVDGAIVASTINLAHQLGLSVVAEGVENDVTFRQLAELGCDVAQGFLVSIPLRPDDLTAWLKHATQPSSAGRRWGSPTAGHLTAG